MSAQAAQSKYRNSANGKAVRAIYNRSAKRKAQRAAYQRSQKGKEADYRGRLKYTHGITIEDYFVMLNQQGGKCAICETTVPTVHKRFHIDHCHETGKIRGLLCHGCNVGLGYFKENVTALKNAVVYLTKASAEDAPRV